MSRLLALAFLLVWTVPVIAQPEQYEFGRRLRGFEAVWEKYDGPVARDRALIGLPKATKHFNDRQLGEAARTLDLAAFELTTDILPSNGRQYLWSLHATPETRVVDGNAKELTVTIQPLYEVRGDMPKGLELQLWFTNKDVVKLKPEKFPLTVKVPLPPMGEFRGLDRKLYFLADGAKELRPAAIGVSQIADLNKRLEALTKAAEGWETIDTIEGATVRDRAKLLAGLAKGDTPDTDLPTASLLENAEAMLDGKPFFTTAKSGQFWLSVPLGEKKSAACRVFIPKGLAKDKPVPVVVAFHGERVGANSYFEAHGAGRIVKECTDRGWILVAPEDGPRKDAPVAAILEKLAERYPMDMKRVFLVGHGDGVRQALVMAATGKCAAVAVLGGGGKLSKQEAFVELPTFIGVGTRDSTGLVLARGLRASLPQDAKRVTYKEYEDVEHLMIVREALEDAFAVFDTAAR